LLPVEVVVQPGDGLAGAGEATGDSWVRPGHGRGVWWKAWRHPDRRAPTLSFCWKHATCATCGSLRHVDFQWVREFCASNETDPHHPSFGWKQLHSPPHGDDRRICKGGPLLAAHADWLFQRKWQMSGLTGIRDPHVAAAAWWSVLRVFAELGDDGC
jgi:hypothetical protein